MGLWPAGQQAADDVVGGAQPTESETAASAELAEQWLGTEPDAIWDDQGVADYDRGARSFPWVAVLLGIVGLAWIGWFAASVTAMFTGMPEPLALPQTIATGAVPLVLLLLVWIAWDRGSQRSVQRHLRLLSAVRGEQHLLADRLAMIDRHWLAAQNTLASRSREFAADMTGASQRIVEAGGSVEQQYQQALLLAASLNEQGEIARRNMDGLVIALPKAEDVARRAAEGMRQAGQSAYQLGGQLEERIAAVHGEASAAETAIAAAGAAFAARAEALAETASLAGQAAERSTERFEASVSRQRDMALEMLADLAAQLDDGARAIEQRLTDVRQRMETATAAQVAVLGTRLTDTEQRIGTIDGAADGIVARTAAAAQALEDRAGQLAAQLAGFEAESGTRLAAITDGYVRLQSELDGVTSASGATGSSAQALIESARACVATLAEATAQVDVALPQALEKLRADTASSRLALESLPPLVAASAAGTATTLERLQQAEQVVAQHAEALTALDRTAMASLASQAEAFAALRASVDDVAAAMAAIRDVAAPAATASAVEAEARAWASAEAARRAVTEAAGNSAAAVEKAIADAIESATGEGVAARIAMIAGGAEQAVAAANAASERLMRQLITIADSSAAIEARVAETSAALATHDRDSLARQFAMASESLQSASVDLTRMLSTDVADQAWEAYLRGDKSIFARRSVRLLNATEAKELLRRYQEDDEFRGLVNHYVRDFEAMLRTIMDTRDGPALSVTLLSSDIGKVYVALAQAIERLRG